MRSSEHISVLPFWNSPWCAVLENARLSNSYYPSDLPFIVRQPCLPDHSTWHDSAQYDLHGHLKPCNQKVIQLKSSEADVVSAILSSETPTLTTAFQISLSTSKDSERAFEGGEGGALRKVRVICPVRHLNDLNVLAIGLCD